MARKQIVLLFIVLAVGLSTIAQTAWVAAQTEPPPPPPPAVVPDMRETKPPVLCADCAPSDVENHAPFDAETHKKTLEGLLNNSYIAELRRALYLQDTFHQLESKVHFDNCDFQSSMEYLTTLLEEAGQHVETAKAAKSSNRSAMEAPVRKAFFALGQALHGVQDFYAHSNYVELQTPKVKRVADIRVLAPWRKEGRDRIGKLQAEGLISGVVPWGFPKKCPAGTLSHSDLAKDSATTKSGGKIVAHLRNRSQYEIAVSLAHKASQSLMRDAFGRWPLLKEINGPNVAFEILLDRRGL